MSRITKWDKEAIVRAIMNDVPVPDKKKRREELQADIIKAMSPECRKLYKKAPHALRTHHFGDLIYDGCSWGTRDVVIGDVEAKTLDELKVKYVTEDRARQNARDSLKAAVMACTTIKQLNDRLPEFKSYFPTIEKPITTLPALANVVADLSKLGWPKGKEVAK
jgi:3-methyladenine DNA glycosylase AlkD